MFTRASTFGFSLSDASCYNLGRLESDPANALGDSERDGCRDLRLALSIGIRVSTQHHPAVADATYSLFGLVSLPLGSWADWVSGTGSFLAVAAALYGYYAVHRQRLRDDAAKERQIAESVEWALLLALNDTYTIAKHLKKALARPFDPNRKPYLFMRVPPLSVPARAVPELTGDQVSFLMRANAPGVLMELSDAIRRYDSIRHGMAEYQQQHTASRALMPARPMAINGAEFSYSVTDEDRARIEPEAALIDEFLAGIVRLVEEGVRRNDALLGAFEEAMRRHFGKWHVVVERENGEGDLSRFVSRG